MKEVRSKGGSLANPRGHSHKTELEPSTDPKTHVIPPLSPTEASIPSSRAVIAIDLRSSRQNTGYFLFSMDLLLIQKLDLTSDLELVSHDSPNLEAQNSFQIFVKTPNGKSTLIWVQSSQRVFHLKLNIWVSLAFQCTNKV